MIDTTSAASNNPGTPQSQGQLQPPSQAAAATRKLPRLRFPFICLLLFWGATVIAGLVNKPYFVAFMFTMLSTALLTLLFLGWWWFNRGMRLWEKAAGFALIIVEVWLVSRFTHRTINPFGMWMIGWPFLVTAIVAWLFLAKRSGLSWTRSGFVAVVSIIWGCFLLIRTEGADSSLKTATHWRWTPTAEERFLAQTKTVVPVSTGLSALVMNSTNPGTRSNDWIAFRGPNRDGVIVGSSIATNWTSNPPVLMWKHPVGPAWSSTIVLAGRLYTQEQRGPKETVVCYDAATGTEVWVHEDAVRFEESVSGTGPRATPTFAKRRLYTLGGTGVLNCLEAETGKAVWTRDIREPSGASTPMWAYSSSPLVTEELVIVYAGGNAGKSLLAYKIESGELAWAVAAGPNSYSSAQLASVAGVQQCLMLHDGGLTAVDPATGKKLWETGQAVKTAPRCAQPHVVNENTLLVGALNGPGTSLIEITRIGGQWTATTKWDSKDLKPEFPDFVIHEGYAYGFDTGIFCCLNLVGGKRAWKEGRYGRGQVMLLRDQGLLLVSSETGELVLLAADSKQLRELGRFQALEGKTWNHPVLVNDRVYLRNAQEMACYSLAGKVATGMALK